MLSILHQAPAVRSQTRTSHPLHRQSIDRIMIGLRGGLTAYSRLLDITGSIEKLRVARHLVNRMRVTRFGLRRPWLLHMGVNKTGGQYVRYRKISTAIRQRRSGDWPSNSKQAPRHLQVSRVESISVSSREACISVMHTDKANREGITKPRRR